MSARISKQVRIGVVGVGGMGQGHCLAIGDVKEAVLTAVCDIDEPTAQTVAEKYGVPYFTDHRALLKSGLVDAITIATPHYQHPDIAIDAFKQGLHVLSEKPIAVTVSAADKMIRAAQKSGKVFAVCYQRRGDAALRSARKLIAQGKLGEVIRVNMLIAEYRSQAYYNSGGWRATWKGEGGGVLFNQAPHMLDIFCWLVGLPKYVTAQTRTTLHDIEVEDEAFALVELANGAHGYIYASTTETPLTYRFEIVGDKGKLLLDDQGLRYWKLDFPISTFTRQNKEMWGAPKPEVTLLTADDFKKILGPEFAKCEATHRGIIRNFCGAILRGEARFAPGEEGGAEVELADAITLSSHLGKKVKLPISRRAYDELLAHLVATSQPKKTVKEQRVTDTGRMKELKR